MGHLHGVITQAASNHVPDRWQQTVRLLVVRGGMCRAHCDTRVAQTLGNTIKDTYIPMLHNVTFEGETIPPPAQIPW